MMNCEQVTRAAGDFIERRLRVRERLLVLAHIAMCRGCRAYIEQLRLTLLGLHSVSEPAAAPPSEDLLERFRQHPRAPKSK
jgi:predicted anti-sigma-YlaC factor YlaD